jgi:hypothetical protein
LNESQPSTQIQIRLSDGSRLKLFWYYITLKEF